MADETTVVHVTHETVAKVGGIGAVLHGFFTCTPYLNAVHRSILVGPLFTTEGSVLDRLGEDGEVLYSSVDGLINPGYRAAFGRIEQIYNVGIVYGRRTFVDPETGLQSSPEVLLVDVRHTDTYLLNEFKRRLYEAFGIQSHHYEHLWEYEQYVRLAPAALAALKALGVGSGATTLVAHEFMGMPTALGAILDIECDFRTVFYAHETATMRRIVEHYPGHDTMFYNVMRQAHKRGLYVEDVFGRQDDYFKHGLVEASKHCDHIYAVGDQVADELRFLACEFENVDIDVVYNGIPAYEIGVAEKLASKDKLQRYCQNLLGYRPDYVFTHVTRLVRSKGLWRDLRVLYEIEKRFREQGATSVFYLLSTEVAKRKTSDIERIEGAYGWPVAHREGWPDLSGGETEFYTAAQEFNARCRNVKIVFINQFGFDPKSCGRRMPEDMEFLDIRKGTDVEFGQSIYEPFGIAQLEPLTFGGLCVCTNVCGCTGFVRDVTNGQDVPNVIVADYTQLGETHNGNVEDLVQIGRDFRNQLEARLSRTLAEEILNRLPKNEFELSAMMERGYRLAKKMSWDVVVRNYLLRDLAGAACIESQTRFRTGA